MQRPKVYLCLNIINNIQCILYAYQSWLIALILLVIVYANQYPGKKRLFFFWLKRKMQCITIKRSIDSTQMMTLYRLFSSTKFLMRNRYQLTLKILFLQHNSASTTFFFFFFINIDSSSNNIVRSSIFIWIFFNSSSDNGRLFFEDRKSTRLNSSHSSPSRMPSSA